jgi:hypothetical protein
MSNNDKDVPVNEGRGCNCRGAIEAVAAGGGGV